MPEASQWNQTVLQYPGSHILQTWQWGQVKQDYGWDVLPQVYRDDNGEQNSAGLVLRRTQRLGPLPIQARVLYVPRGPLVQWEDRDCRLAALQNLQQLAREQNAIFIKIDPEVIVATGIPGDENELYNATGEQVVQDLRQLGWRFSPDQIQFRNTVWLSLEGSQEDWLGRMKQKTRYNLRLARRKGVQVRTGSEDDLALLYRMYAETSLRDGFVIRPEDYYLDVWRTFMHAGLAEPLIAEVEGEAVAGLVLFHFGQKAWYLYGMSRPVHRERMPNYLLQWTAMERARQYGCTCYDLWGAPDEFNENDSMWNVYRFKEGLGGSVAQTIGAWDYPANPGMYTLYTRLLPKILNWMRRRGVQRTRSEAGL
ncbi:MAG: peptidoglycan bridge formation glycyltransferase FemA/FemB family protein [Chloroflexi bacterium]|nr:peptidoglycan bridge formation glycyltransferase FemA/FemB family protein [Chloroflexota bacterium]